MLIAGRPLRDDEYPALTGDLVEAAIARTADGGREPLPLDLREWLRRTLQLDVRHSFRSLAEAQDALDQLLSSEGSYNADVSSLETFLNSYYTKPAPAAPKPNLVVESAVRRSEARIEIVPPVKAASVQPTPAVTFVCPLRLPSLINSLLGIVICLSLVVIVGFVGQISVVQLALAGVAGFTMSHLTTDVGGIWAKFPISLLIGASVATIVGLLVAVSALRVRGVSLVVVTLAAAVALEQFGFLNALGRRPTGSPVTQPRSAG